MTAINFATTDICDQFENDIHMGTVRVLPAVFKCFGQIQSFYGQAVTIKAFEDNSVIKKILENENGVGKVLVVDGGASMRCALVGGNLATAATKNGWAGVIVDGCVRDLREIEPLNVAICAIGVHPMRSLRKDAGERDVSIQIQGICISPNDWVYYDENGMVVSKKALI